MFDGLGPWEDGDGDGDGEGDGDTCMEMEMEKHGRGACELGRVASIKTARRGPRTAGQTDMWENKGISKG